MSLFWIPPPPFRVSAESELQSMIGNCSSLLNQLCVHCCFLPLHHFFTSRSLHLFLPQSISPLILSVSLPTSFFHLSPPCLPPLPLPHPVIPPILLPRCPLLHNSVTYSFFSSYISTSHHSSLFLFQIPFVPPYVSLSSLHNALHPLPSLPPSSLPSSIRYSSHPHFSSLSVTWARQFCQESALFTASLRSCLHYRSAGLL